MSKPHIVTLSVALALAACSSGSAPTPAVPTGNSASVEGPGATPTATHDDAGLRAVITGFFAPYARAGDPPSVESLPYTAATGALLTAWRRAQPEGEVSDLADFDWLCQCQDWDAAQFRVDGQDIAWTGDDTATVTVHYRASADANTSLRLMMKREGGAWKIDDMRFADLPQPLTQMLRDETNHVGQDSGSDQ